MSQGMAASFVVRLTAAGVYSRSFSVPTVTDVLNWGDFLIDDVAFATDGSIYAGGRFYGMRDLEYLLGGSAQGVVLKSAGRSDGFLMKLTPFGGLEWARRYGSTGDDGVTRVAVNSAGTVFAGGEFAGRVDFDPGPGIIAITPTGTRDAFLLRLNAGGGLSAVRSYGSVATSTLLFQLTVGSNGSAIWTGVAAGRSLNLAPGGAAAVLMRPLLNATRPWIGEVFAKEVFAPGAFAPAGMVIAGIEFGSTSLGYALRSAGRVVQVTFSGGFASASRPGSGWTAVAARPAGGGYELLWRNGQTGGWSIWSLDAAGVRTGERAAGLAAIWSMETQHGVDINRDGRIGAPPVLAFTPQRKLGITEFGTTAAGYALRVNSRVVQISHGGVNASAVSPGDGWVARAARRVDTGFEVLWRNTRVGGWSAWTVDASGAKTGERGMRLVDVYALERNFNTDITGDGTVGAPGGNGGGGPTTGEWWQTWWQGTWEGSVDDPGNGKDRAAMRYNLRLTFTLLDDPDGTLTGKRGWGEIGVVLSINDDHRTWNVRDKFMLDFAKPGVEPGLPADVSALGGMVYFDTGKPSGSSWPPDGSYKNVYYPVVQIMKSQTGPASGFVFFWLWPVGTPLGDGAPVAWKKVQ